MFNFMRLEIKRFNYPALYDADYKKIMENLEVIAGANSKGIYNSFKTAPFSSKATLFI